MRRSITTRRSRRRIKREFELQLTSMMDMLIIIVVFMLKSYSASNITLTTSPNIKLPTSNFEEVPQESPSLIIEPTGITFDNEKVVEFPLGDYKVDPKLLADGGRRILPLFDALVKSREKAELLMSKVEWKDTQGKQATPPKFQGTIIIQADKAIRYDFLKNVMYTAGAAQYKVFKLVTVKKDAG